MAPPLRPTREDVERLRAAWGASFPGGVPAGPLKLLLLGVTPEYATFPWSDDCSLTAVDNSQSMIRAVWPADAGNRTVLAGDWLQLPLSPGTFHLIVNDNGPTVVGAGRLVELGRQLRRVLRPDGRVVMRLIIRPEIAESLDMVARLAWSGHIRNFHELKFRLLMAQQADDSARGVRLGDAWDSFTRLFPNRASLAAHLGCAREVVSTIDVYRESDDTYHFYSLAEVARDFADFELKLGPGGEYPFADRCPVFSLTPRT